MKAISKIALAAVFAPVVALADGTATNPNEVISANEFGVMKVNVKQKLVALPVPFGGAAGAYNATAEAFVATYDPITLPYLLQKSSLPDGTTAYIYNRDNKNYDVYVLDVVTSGETTTYTWVPQKKKVVSVGGTSNEDSTAVDTKTVSTGHGFFLEFPSDYTIPNSGTDIYLYGQVLNGSFTTTVEAGKTALVCPPKDDCAYVCTVSVANPTATTLGDKNKIAEEGDKITITDNATGATRVYYYIDNAWKYRSNNIADIKNPWTTVDAISLPAGNALWYTNVAEEGSKTVTWTARKGE